MVVKMKLEDRVLYLRNMGYRLWRIAVDVKKPLHVVADILNKHGMPMFRLNQAAEYKDADQPRVAVSRKKPDISQDTRLKRAILSKRREGLRVWRIAKELGCDKWVVIEELNRNGIPWCAAGRDAELQCQTEDRMKAVDMKPGDVFRLPGKRKWRVAHAVYPLEPRLRKSNTAGILVCFANCDQMELEATQDVEVRRAEVSRE